MATKILPGKSELRQMIASGMTHKEIAEAVSLATGHPVQRGAVSVAIHRAGLASPAKKFTEEIPWTVREEHQAHYAARMLRLLGRRRAGIRNSKEMDDRLNSWLRTLREAHAVVTYLPNTDQGFYNIDGEWQANGVPIKVELKL